MRRLTRATLYANATTANAMNVHGRTYRGGRSERATRPFVDVVVGVAARFAGMKNAHVAFAVAVAFVREGTGDVPGFPRRSGSKKRGASIGREVARASPRRSRRRVRGRDARLALRAIADGGGFGIDDGGAFFERPGEHGGAEGIVGDERLGGVQWESRGGAQATAAREPRLDGASFEGLARGRDGDRVAHGLEAHGAEKVRGRVRRARRILDVEGGVVGSRSRRTGSGDHAGSAEGIGGYRGESGGVTGAIIVLEETRHVVAFFSGDGRPEAARARTRARQRRAGRARAVTRTARGRARRTRQAGSRARLWRRGATVEAR